jgi:membrane associated rhomboid family serine protease
LLVPRPDPHQESIGAAGKRFRAALQRAVLIAAALWVILLIDTAIGVGLSAWGTGPRRLQGLLGLISMPLIHGGVGHLATNTLPLILLGTGLQYFYPRTALRVLPWFWIAPGLFVWIFGADGSTHYGASGFNFAMLGYLSLGGLLRRDAATLALSMVTLFLYGGMFSGILPVEDGVSWEGHLGGLLTGFVAAIIYRRWDVPAARRYTYEDEEQEDAEESGRMDGSDSSLNGADAMVSDPLDPDKGRIRTED